MTASALRVLIGLVTFALPASAETINAHYVVYTGGFKALSIEAEAATADGAYGVQASLKTLGVVDWMLGFAQKLEARGTLGSSALPRVYVSDGVFWRKHRTTRLDYARDGRVTTSFHPVEDRDDDRLPVPEELKVGTIDPATAFVAVNRAAAEGGSPCLARIPIFDGRRRFNAILEDDGVAVVEASRYSIFSGPALRCRFSMERLAGFHRSPRFDAKTPRVSVLYLARFGQSDQWLPVRLESESTFGNVIGHLVKVDAPLRPLGRTPRPAS